MRLQKITTPLKLRVFVDDMTLTLDWGNKEVAEMAKKVMKKLQDEVGEKNVNLSVTENGMEGKGNMIASCGCLEDKLRQCSKQQGATMADSVKTLGVDGSRRKNEKEEVQGEILAHQED